MSINWTLINYSVVLNFEIVHKHVSVILFEYFLYKYNEKFRPKSQPVH